MKAGKTLQQLAAELERQQDNKRDFIADTRQLSIVTPQPKGEDDQTPWRLKMNGHGLYPMTKNTHRQIAQRTGIPQKYYDRLMTTAPDLLVDNVSHWFEEEPEQRMIRTLDGNARAFLSNRYRPLDNYDLAHAVLPVLQEANGMRIMSVEITEARMYIKATFPGIRAEIAEVGDVVESGVAISNSEIGQGRCLVEGLYHTLGCKNGMILAHSFGKHHVGRIVGSSDLDVMEMFRDATLQADDKAFWMKIQDVVRGSLDEATFRNTIRRLRETVGNKIEADPVKAVEVVAKKYNLTDGERSGVLRHLIEGADLSQYGLLNAVTRYSQDVEDYDRATELERLGGIVLELPRNAWKEIAEAA